MKKIILLMAIVGFSSCYSLQEQDYSIYESFQIGNSSAHEIILRFYQNNAPKNVYYEVANTPNPIYVSGNDNYKEKNSLAVGSTITLAAGQMVLFYTQDRFGNPDKSRYRCLSECGSSNNALFIFLNRVLFVGDSVTVSYAGEQESILPISQNELWETWYDEEKFTYYHFWRIE